MAGTVAVRSTTTNSLSDEWEISFARFIPFPHSSITSSSSSDLHPLPVRLRNRPPRGTWISSSTSAFLRFSSDLNFSDVVLTVAFNAKLLVTPITFPFSISFLLSLLHNRCNWILIIGSDEAWFSVFGVFFLSFLWNLNCGICFSGRTLCFEAEFLVASSIVWSWISCSGN